MMKKFLLIVSILFISFGLFSCDKNIDDDRIDIVTTNFVQYSITKEIVKDKCGVKMVLRPGQDSHSFDPTIDVVININKADMFIYTSEYVETWAEKLISKLNNGPIIIKSGKGISFKASLHEHHDDHIHDDDEDHSGHDHSLDPHIWTSIKNAIIMAQNIVNAIISLDPDNKDFYMENAIAYTQTLSNLEKEYHSFFEEHSNTKLFFVSPFSFLYMCDEYDINYVTLYSTCSTEVEPSATDLISMIKQIEDENVKYIYKKELVSSEVADKIAEVTNTTVLILHSADNVSVEDYLNGITYYEIMRSNLDSLKKGLS